MRTPLQVPDTTPVEGALMVADITGFTAITEKYAQHGPLGIEVLTRSSSLQSKRYTGSDTHSSFIIAKRCHETALK